MKFVLSSQAIKELDRRSEELGVPSLLLMESAGRGLAEELRRWLADVRGRRILGVCGRGGNGGDALCALRYLGLWGAEVRAIVLGEPAGPAASEFQAFSASFPERVRTVHEDEELEELRDWFLWAEVILLSLIHI